MKFSLEWMDFDIYWIMPLFECSCISLAPLGLDDMMNGAGAVTSVTTNATTESDGKTTVTAVVQILPSLHERWFSLYCNASPTQCYTTCEGTFPRQMPASHERDGNLCKVLLAPEADRVVLHWRSLTD